MAREGTVVEATTINNTKSLLLSRPTYACSLSCTEGELRSFQSYLRWMCIDQFDARHAVVSWSLFLLLDIFVSLTSPSTSPTSTSSPEVVYKVLWYLSGLEHVSLAKGTVELVHVVLLHLLTLLDQLVKKEEATKTVVTNEDEESKIGDAEGRGNGDEDAKKEEEGPEDHYVSSIRPKAPELIISVGEASVMRGKNPNQWQKDKSQETRNEGVGFKASSSCPSQSSAGIPPKPCSGSVSKSTKQRRKTKGVNQQPSPQGATSGDNPPCRELWAGFSFSNSPAPSSLPIPKFSVPQNPK
ncbi:hypothetical protein BHE74_00021384 [Ensete ventricosum]|nr:hypothetical protein BHE74_00021384 [Ensete ventricosum]